MSVNRRILNKKFLIYAVTYLLILVLFIWGITELLDFSGMVEEAVRKLLWSLRNRILL